MLKWRGTKYEMVKENSKDLVEVLNILIMNEISSELTEFELEFILMLVTNKHKFMSVHTALKYYLEWNFSSPTYSSLSEMITDLNNLDHKVHILGFYRNVDTNQLAVSTIKPNE